MADLQTDPRARARTDFIKAAGWGDADVRAFPGDASTRSYFRLSRGQDTAILMDAPGASEAPACPIDASEDERIALGYNAVARLAGNNTTAFAALSGALTARGFSAPRIFEADLDQGFLIIEDLTDALFARLIPAVAHEGALYATAVETLGAIYRSSFERQPTAFGKGWTVQDYDALALHAETELFTDWYAPWRGKTLSEADKSDWRKAWDQVLPHLDNHAPGLVLRDFHAENLIWLPQREHEAKVGLLDFQDALFGHPAYDLVSLIEDARRDVAGDLAKPLTDRFFNAAGLADREAFDAAAAVLAAQRNAKILGIFVRLAQRDGKPKYLDLLPRVERHFVCDLAHPALAPVKAAVMALTPSLFEKG
ncbi:aminoglycoside phosphotransferase family protein [Oceanicaulis sp. LC35]|uniref:aminoglycoside phosphotransferase family protein n=1 Tax=Oceanicaulis sp. LC35 TaxID=3349635 RepID=UPI003F847592